VRSSYEDRTVVHAAGDLVDHVIDCVAIAQHSASVNMLSKEDDFRLQGRIARSIANLIDRFQLRIGKAANRDKSSFLPLLDCFKVGANQFSRPGIERHQ